ncbi:MAG: hypothetical protein LBL38_01770 [Lactobacillales bacterium]|jgi:hypothetical protein|nr:hypothetical protein [Lactobacillales bacterium]
MHEVLCLCKNLKYYYFRLRPEKNDTQIDTALDDSQNAEYSWVKDGGTRELIIPTCNSGNLGYLFTSTDEKKQAFWSLTFCTDLGISQHTFTCWEKVQKGINCAQKQRQIFGTKTGATGLNSTKLTFG